MEVFHYLATRLHDTPLFEVAVGRSSTGDRGSIYNGFDKIDWEKEEEECTCVQHTIWHDILDVNAAELVSEEVTDTAFLEADRNEPARWAYNSPMFDCTSDINSVEYHYKVIRLIIFVSMRFHIVCAGTYEGWVCGVVYKGLYQFPRGVGDVI